MATTKLIIKQGKTFSRVFYWENKAVRVFKAITAITKAAPVQITAVGHGLVTNWKAAVTGARGMSQINASTYPPRSSDYRPVTRVSADIVTISDIDSSKYKTYTSGGFLTYFQPVDLTGYTARMTIKDVIGGTTLLSLTPANNRIIIDTAAYSITVTLAAADTDDLIWTKGVFDLELVSSTDVVTELDKGTVTVIKEVTT
jgi:hypothetical protein